MSYLKPKFDSFVECLFRIHNNIFKYPITFLKKWHFFLFVYKYLFADIYVVYLFLSYTFIYTLLRCNRLIALVDRVFANGPRDLGSIPGHFIPKTWKMVLDTSLLNTQQYEVRTKGKVKQSREKSRALSYISV